MTENIGHNDARQFDLSSEEKQRKVLEYIKAHFTPGIRGNSKNYSSYYLKHVVETGIGEYVGNGELKGAMLKAGYKYTKDTLENEINWGFILQKLRIAKGKEYQLA